MKSVVITGASTGIGKSTAILLAEMGWQVFAGVRKETDANELIRVSNGKIQPIQLDVTDSESIHAAAALVESKCKELNGLVNNA
ncbi:MAG: SDR family NAD(P)-dependent oxidoreductase, partial [Bacteroidia bacterium]|nr:SDR family NAD(P)-dependent oxidoreductase [Bacteroidia bacterium]